MQVVPTQINSLCIRLAAVGEDGGEQGHVYLYLIQNDLHTAPYGLVEDLFVIEQYRRHGIATTLIGSMIQLAKDHHCYKLIGTSRMERTEVHKYYENLGFAKYGYEFRMDL